MQIARLRAHRVHLTLEHEPIAQDARRALHELEIASIDLTAAQNRREMAGAQLEKARAGVLGVDYVPTDVPLS